ncbi:Uncharacterised protein (plasmid) [Tsukamurella tyrosinosolvens]|uniref:Uncharacterized protein n=1 Tax=Tsukamurella tyrosinosolvens TaxID=57704 RepID=A0A1H4UU63_TSUTY|nr:hypothetical protein [Tsukamurella tyrosinosolvens]SEC72257.1 hypothetical protein SAMN04489793_3037 [Tsukamurella tyrosinosolvens]VEH90879.1 Uncharacterised protein [Tsukamurella tyrosinosolvens]
MTFEDVDDSPGELITVDDRGRTNLAKAGARGRQYTGHRHADRTITLTPTTPLSD